MIMKYQIGNVELDELDVAILVILKDAYIFNQVVNLEELKKLLNAEQIDITNEILHHRIITNNFIMFDLVGTDTHVMLQDANLVNVIQNVTTNKKYQTLCKEYNSSNPALKRKTDQ